MSDTKMWLEALARSYGADVADVEHFTRPAPCTSLPHDDEVAVRRILGQWAVPLARESYKARLVSHMMQGGKR